MTRRQARKIVKAFLSDWRHHPLERVRRAQRVAPSIRATILLVAREEAERTLREMTRMVDSFYLTSCSKMDLDALHITNFPSWRRSLLAPGTRSSFRARMSR